MNMKPDVPDSPVLSHTSWSKTLAMIVAACSRPAASSVSSKSLASLMMISSAFRLIGSRSIAMVVPRNPLFTQVFVETGLSVNASTCKLPE